jgi:hypothetical protein
MPDWDPSRLSAGTLTAWYKADSLSLSDGSEVGFWTDSSGNGNDVGQLTSGRRPTFETNELNSQPVLRFDGSNDILTDGDIAALDVGTGDIWMATVFKSTDNSAAQNYFEKRPTSFGLRTTSAGELQMVLGSTSNIPSQSNGNWSRTAFVIVTASRVSSTCNGFINGTASTTTGTTNSTSISNSDVFDIGSRAVGAGPMNGDMAEILVGGATLDTNERQKIEGYLAHKYGLQGNLPSDHPYKSAAPGYRVQFGISSGLVDGGLIQA